MTWAPRAEFLVTAVSSIRTQIATLLVSFILAFSLFGSVRSVLAQRWEDLTEEEQDRALHNYQKYERLLPEERQHLDSAYSRWKSLSPKERDLLRERHERYRQLPEQERDRLRQRLER